MTLLTENPYPLIAIGAILATFAGLVFLSRRTGRSLTALVGIVGITLLLLIVERVIVTDREEINDRLSEVLSAIKANDSPLAVTYLAANPPTLRTDAKALMEQLRVKHAGASAVQTSVDSDSQPPKAMTKFRAAVNANTHKGGVVVRYFDDVHLHWIKQNGSWVIERYDIYLKGRLMNPGGKFDRSLR